MAGVAGYEVTALQYNGVATLFRGVEAREQSMVEVDCGALVARVAVGFDARAGRLRPVTRSDTFTRFRGRHPSRGIPGTGTGVCTGPFG